MPFCRAPLLVLLLVASMLGAGRGIGLARQGQVDAGGWVSLGPRDVSEAVSQVAVSPAWPSDGFMLAEDAGGLARTFDGGASWERLPSHQGAQQVASRQGAGSLVVAFASEGRLVFRLGGGRVERSRDDGQSWEPVLVRPSAARLSLHLSPTFVEDGVAFAGQHGPLLGSFQALFRSTDAGATWEAVEPAPGQQVQGIAISPDFARDRTVFVAATAGGFNRAARSAENGWRPTHAEASVGVLVSRDGGASWQPASDGLDVDGVPHRHVEELAISPDFGREGTMFAYTWGPPAPAPPTGRPEVTLALFRSEDGGRSWSAVWRHHPPLTQAEDAIVGRYFDGELAVRPDFARSGAARLSILNLGERRPGGTCDAAHSSDRGLTWGPMEPYRDRPGCGGSQVVAASGSVVSTSIAYSALTSHGFWYRSRDGERNWEALLPPGYEPRRDFLAARLAPDGTVLIGAASGVWALGPDASPD